MLFADFGRDAYGNLKIGFSGEPPAGEMTVRLGEKLTEHDAIDRQPPGSVNYREVRLTTCRGQRDYRLTIPRNCFTKARHPSRRPARSAR